MPDASSMSLPWSGSVIPQQPSLPLQYAAISMFPASSEYITGKLLTRMAPQIPPSPQDNSSVAIASSFARSAGGISSMSMMDRPRPAALARATQSGESAATTASAGSLSSTGPSGRMTSTAYRCTLSCTARSISDNGGSRPLMGNWTYSAMN